MRKKICFPTEKAKRRTQPAECIAALPFAAVFALFIALSPLPAAKSVFTLGALAAEKEISGLGTGSIANPTFGAGGWSYVYFGTYEGTPVKYRVLAKSTSEFGERSMLLDCDSTLCSMPYEAGFDPLTPTARAGVGWENSAVRAFLENDFYRESFTPQERAAVSSSVKSDFCRDGRGKEYLGTQELTGEHVFALDAKEATRASYGFSSVCADSDTRIKRGADAWWWLRSPDISGSLLTGKVTYYGGIYNNLVRPVIGVSPACNIRLSSVIFSSVVSGGYKLTIRDADMFARAETCTRTKDTVTVPYAVSAGTDRVSVLVTDGAYTPGMETPPRVKYYGALVTGDDKLKATGTGVFTLPAGYAAATDRIYILAEKTSGSDKLTDYAALSAPLVLTVNRNAQG